ncbi:MAG: molybdopterin molybdotransferase MoeA, partial [Erythrobacter sp.]|nr:molybdopterin molybdotransferase MoeA [Erythrobacter sp.]
MTATGLSVELAQERMLALLAPLPTETMPVEKARGRYLASPLVASRTQPHADLSAMDGYATAGEGPWQRVGESRCGEPYNGNLAPGQCVRISTGAILPAGSQAILIQENAHVEGGAITATQPVEAGRHIRRKGFEFEAGDQLLSAGTRIAPAQMALVRAAGQAEIETSRRPRLAILDCGDELSSDPAQCAVHQIPASNAAMLEALAAGLAGTVERHPPLPDRLDNIVVALEAHRDADMLILTGGASVGDHDLIRPALEKIGARLDFWKVAMKPGKPLMVARHDSQIILGLPGNPVSAFVTGFLFMLPGLRKLAGAAECLPTRL